MSTPSLALLAQCLLVLSAFAGFCLAGKNPGPKGGATHLVRWRGWLRGYGWITLSATAVIAVQAAGWGPGLAGLVGVISFAVFIVIGLATYRRQFLPRVFVIAAAAGAATLVPLTRAWL
ncbi:DUF3325 family protein [Microbulbifer sp. SH-1]|uniref:DUF3325 family protein n=1 Tax=Microbulbifer sp. SH-1 TaxID=2681547 RepID=UPI0014089C3D|nr:DUF3325 family protein [Microbulbifer sp. SH-1]QIL91077.1 DUF3325 family protein [Microbulbifer sp. SH-1]